MSFTSKMLKKSSLVITLCLLLVACGSPEPLIEGEEPSFRRITEQQYRNIIADVFGHHIIVAGTFDPILRSDELVAVGAGSTTISRSSFEKYEKLAQSIADQVVSEQNRSVMISCEPQSPDAPDPACVETFLKSTGRILYRRPLRDEEIAQAVQIAGDATEKLGSFYDGLAISLSSFLISPNFLFVIEDVNPASGNGGQTELTAYAKAAKLSFFLWNTTPDHELLDAAESGALDTRKGLKVQVDRLMQSPRLRDGVRAFFSDMLHADDFEHLEKDKLIYPAFDQEIVDDAEEQLLRTIVHHLLDEDGDYRELFSTRKTFMSAALGRIYRVPVADQDLWSDYEFPETDVRRGIQNLAGFIAQHSHPASTSPTLRGKGVRELLLCQKVPDPPADIDFSIFNEASSQPMTARQRLAIHNAVPSCAGCHRLTDDIGLSMENLDGAGQFRANDSGMTINTSGTLDGVAFEGPADFAVVLSQNPAIPTCLVERTVSYAFGRSPGREYRPWLDYINESFADGGYRIRDLLLTIAMSENFYSVATPRTTADIASPEDSNTRT